MVSPASQAPAALTPPRVDKNAIMTRKTNVHDDCVEGFIVVSLFLWTFGRNKYLYWCSSNYCGLLEGRKSKRNTLCLGTSNWGWCKSCVTRLCKREFCLSPSNNNTTQNNKMSFINNIFNTMYHIIIIVVYITCVFHLSFIRWEVSAHSKVYDDNNTLLSV